MRETKRTYEQLENRIAELEAKLKDCDELKKIASKQKESEEKYRALYDNAPLAYQSLDSNGCILDVNPKWLKTLGYEKEEVLGKWFGDFLHPDFVPHFKNKFPEFKRIGVIHNVQYRLIKKDGTDVYVSFEGCIGYDEQGRFKQTYCTFKDITEQKLVEKALRESEELFRFTFEQAAVGIATTDRSGRIMSVNQKFCDIVGYTKTELLEKVFTEITCPEDLHLEEPLIEKVLADKLDTFSIEKRYIHKNGSIVWIQLYSSVVRDQDRNIKYAVAAIVDITERKKLEKQASENEQRYKDAEKIAHVGSWTMDIETGKSNWSDEFFRICGFKPGSMKPTAEIGLNLIHPDDRNKATEAVNKTIESGKPYSIQKRIVRPNGETRWVQSLGELIYDESNKPIKLIGSFHDITEKKKSEERILESLSLLEITLESTDNGILVVDEHRNILRLNKRFKELWKVPEEVIKHSNDRELLEYVLTQVKNPDEFLKSVEYQYQHPEKELHEKVYFKDGRVFQKYSKAMFLEGKPIARIWSFRDITNRIQAEQNLLESKAFLSNILDNLPVGVAVYDKDFNYVLINKTIEKFTGKKAGALIGKNAFKLFPHLKKSGLHNHSRKALEGEVVVSPDYKDPHGEWYYAIYYPNKDASGSIIGVIAQITNITERKEAEKRIKESEARYKAMFYENKSVMVLIDPANRQIVDANDSAVKYYGYPKKMLISMDISELNTFSDEEVEKEMESALNENRNYFQFKHRLSSGEIRDVQVYSGKIRFENKDLLYSIIHDNTNEIHAKQKLREQNEEYLAINEELEESLDRIRQATEDLKTEKLKAEINESKAKSLLSAIPDMMFIFNKEGIITDYHAERNSDLYIPPEVFLNKKVDDTLPAPLPELTHTVIEKVLRTGEIQEYNYELDMKGEKHYFNARMVMLSATKTMSIVRDVTDSKRAQQELLKAKEKAEESDRLKSAFLANMSHEIRTPMNGIIGFSEMLMSPNLTEERRSYFSKIIIDSSRQLLNIVNDILDISMIESDSIKVKKEEVVVNDVIMDLYAFFKAQSNNKTIALHTYTPLPDQQSIVITDKDRVKQVISNLLNNALKFTHEGYIKFGYRLVDHHLQFFVEDTGIGIAKDQLTNIFERFRQEDLELTRQYGGTGLGLSISQKLAELLGGNLWVESEKGKGSVFYFAIPYQPVFNETGETAEIPSPEKNGKLTILIAEDEEVNHLYIQELLTGRDIKLIHARNGREAVEMCREDPAIGLILMDIKMPLMNGYEATREIKKFRPEVPIIAQTAYAMTEDREKVLSAGCDGYLSKPINVAELLSIIEQYKKKEDQ